MKYDYLIVGSGLFGATFAYFSHKQGKRCLVIDKRPQLGGNVYCEKIEGINVHKYGAHIFHTSNKKVWDFVNSIVPFNRYTNSPVANFHGKLYNLPFNMNTFAELWGVRTPEEAQAKIGEQKAEAVAKMKADGVTEPRNLEEQALTLIGKDVYEKLIKEYTEKQWGRKCTELPAFIIKRLPVRLVFDNNYFNDSYQGIPIGGYNKLIEGLGLSPTLPRREGDASPLQLASNHSLQEGKSSLPTGEGRGEADGCIDCLVGIDVPLNQGKKETSLENGGYRRMADPINYKLLEEKAKEMRKNPTDGETAFWNIVSGDNGLDAKFRRQHIIENYIVDFVCLEKRLVVEIDGGYHNDSQQEIADNQRSQDLKDYGFTILRLKNEEVISDPEQVKTKLRLALWLAQKAPLREGFGEAANTLVYTGQIDEFFDYKYGRLNWRTVSFKTRVEDKPNYQGNAVVNYTSHDVPYTRVIEHKHFEMFGQQVYDNPKTVVSEEYSTEYKPGMEPYYPVNDEKNNEIAEKYRKEAASLNPSRRGTSSLPTGEGQGEAEGSIIFGGRLAEYKYYDMAPIIEKVMNMFNY